MIPNLQHPIPIDIVQVVRGTAPQDPDYREPVQVVKYAPAVTCQGQVKWGEAIGLDVTRIGTQDDSDGYVVFRTVDLRMVGITLHINDRITAFGAGADRLERMVFIVKLEPMAHSRGGGATMLKAHFKDRQPTRGT